MLLSKTDLISKNSDRTLTIHLPFWKELQRTPSMMRFSTQNYSDGILRVFLRNNLHRFDIATIIKLHFTSPRRMFFYFSQLID